MMTTTSNDITRFIKEAVKLENFKDCEIQTLSSTGKTDGYAGYVIFVSVTGTTKDSRKKVMELAVKCGKADEDFRKRAKPIFKREIYFYKKILPIFEQFQLDNNVEHIFDSVPKCYKTLELENENFIIIMENLKTQGYVMANRLKTLNQNHINLVLKEYGKFHAISFALRVKNPKVLEELTSDYNMWRDLFNGNNFPYDIQAGSDIVIKILQDESKLKLLNNYKKLIEHDIVGTMLQILNTREPQSAILHGDCWNNNYLYKYKIDDQSIPLKVAILDWQLSGYHSPVLDLSLFLYCNCSKDQLEKLTELLNIYYDSFSSYLKQLGCNPIKVFPFSQLKIHWEKYSLFGVLMVSSFLHLILCSEEDAPDFSSVNELESRNILSGIKIRDRSYYMLRLTSILSHHFTFKF